VVASVLPALVPTTGATLTLTGTGMGNVLGNVVVLVNGSPTPATMPVRGACDKHRWGLLFLLQGSSCCSSLLLFCFLFLLLLLLLLLLSPFPYNPRPLCHGFC
jgi:hypothetical protein